MKTIAFIILFAQLISYGNAQSTETTDPLKKVELVTIDGDSIEGSMAWTPRQQSRGLQNVRESQFDDNDGKLFFYLQDRTRTFWMPNTFFNLDIIYLDQKMKIIDIVWNLQHFTGNERSRIPRAPAKRSRHVLEMKAGSPISSKLQVGDTLKWKSSLTIKETERRIRERL